MYLETSISLSIVVEGLTELKTKASQVITMNMGYFCYKEKS